MSLTSSPTPPGPSPSMAFLKQKASEILQQRQAQNLLRTLSPSPLDYSSPSTSAPTSSSPPCWITWCEEQAYSVATQLLELSSIPMPLNVNTNDYLGLQRSGTTVKMDQKLLSMLPLGGLSARLVGGNHPIFEALEHTIAQDLGFERALYCPSGTMANHALAQTLAALQGPQQQPWLHVFSDRLNHASIIHGLRHASIHKRIIYPHLDFRALHSLLTTHPSPCPLIWSESMYSMDGDGPTDDDLLQLHHHQGGVLVLDEAHSLGITGPEGKGLTKSLSALVPSLISVYPCGKALGAAGAIICGPHSLLQLLINISPDFIYTTAPSPVMAASVLTRYLTLKHLHPLRQRLYQISHHIHHQLTAMGLHVKGQGSPLLAIILDSPQRALQISHHLRSHHHILTTPIRYPSVPQDSPRIRLSLHPFLQPHHCHTLIQALKSAQRICQ